MIVGVIPRQLHYASKKKRTNKKSYQKSGGVITAIYALNYWGFMITLFFDKGDYHNVLS